MTLIRRLCAGTCAIALVAGFGTAGAYAQSTETSTEENASDDTITITGSRIRRSNASAAIPVQVLNAQAVQETGSVDVGEIVTQIPGVNYELSPENTGLSVQNPGLSTVNLRRLGGDRTLTLIDGRRAVSNAGNGERVSLDTIPSGFIDSIEVTIGSASAIYGSDAIAGVVNVILKDDWEGFEVNMRYGEAEASGEEETNIDLTWGRNFAGGRGNFLLGFSYEEEGAIFADETRPDSIQAVNWSVPGDEGNFNDETILPGCDNSGKFCINPTGSAYLPGGKFESDDAWNVDGVWFNDQSLLPNDGRTSAEAWETYPDGFNDRIGRTLSPEYEIYTLAAKTDFELTPNVSIFFDGLYTELETMTRNAPEIATDGDTFAVLDANGMAMRDADGRVITDELREIASSNPFIHPAVQETRVGAVAWDRRFTEVGWDDKINERNTLRTAFGFEGNIWEDWEWTLYGTYGRFEQTQTTPNELNLRNINFALDVQSDGARGFQCADAAARADGCVPLNIFGTNSISDAAADYIRYTAVLEQERTQKTFAGSMNGDLFQLPAGMVKAAFGFEYREEEQKTSGQDGDLLLVTTTTAVPDIEAGFDVTEIYGEADIPILDTLSAQLALRVADYSTVGEVVSYNVGGSWFPTDDIRFRAQYSRSQRAPTLTEFFSPPRGDFDSLDDPCSGLNADGTGITPPSGSDVSAATIAANCLAEAGIQAYFANPDNAGQPFEGDGSVRGPNQGNSNLTEETADTFTAGFVLTPSAIPNLIIIVDYYDIKVEDAIGSIETQLTADLCYTATDFPDNRFCNVITRNGNSGEVAEVINQVENLNELVAEGIDAAIDYEWEFGFAPGEFDINVIYTHYLENSFTFQGLNGPEEEEQLGQIDNPEDEYRAKLGYSIGDFRATWTALYRSGGVDDLDVADDAPDYFKAGSQTFHNLYLSYILRDEPRVRLYGGVNNVFDEIGPLIPSGLDAGSSRNIVSSLNDTEGREFFAGVSARW